LTLCLASCVEVFVLERGVVYSHCRVVIPRWRSLYGRFRVDIVKILLCEGGDVEQWLKPQNISRCLCLIHYLSTLSLFIACIALHCSFLYARYSLCVPTLIFNEESLLKHLSS